MFNKYNIEFAPQGQFLLFVNIVMYSAPFPMTGSVFITWVPGLNKSPIWTPLKLAPRERARFVASEILLEMFTTSLKHMAPEIRQIFLPSNRLTRSPTWASNIGDIISLRNLSLYASQTISWKVPNLNPAQKSKLPQEPNSCAHSWYRAHSANSTRELEPEFLGPARPLASLDYMSWVLHRVDLAVTEDGEKEQRIIRTNQ